ncbi:MAG: dUTP diphosphatase [Candidatus Komeilibacteria bacterium CG_4_10_14_0_2_um_filter_37_10]|uniref:dUTP diphosphatase n=1 Tax=Candidatus Komeilibacteria bacterium CG_4_10_14_0_2_um_filter_37_10 TaxID=1974470 RepID=A0A2M7VE07_9BACT|nr:MAG: dUTP diphosphatase [Candidatus Komeilibacteria bacterium CG_4_10_14_0_2_um_filter_37_10]
MILIKIKKLKPEAIIPRYALPGDAGLDLFSCEDATINPGERYSFHTGIALEYPEGYCSLVWDKSGLSQKFGLKVLGGVFEHTYRGEYIICLLNLSKEPYCFKAGDKIAQLLIQPVATAEIEEVAELSESVRGEGRHGHTGK